MTKHEIDEFEAIQGQIESLHQELTTLTKKSPSDLLNKFKLTLINGILIRANAVLGKNNLPFKDFAQFEEDQLPSNSDTLMVVGQYRSALEKLRGDNIVEDYTAWYWLTTDVGGQSKSKSSLRTAPPSKIALKK